MAKKNEKPNQNEKIVQFPIQDIETIVNNLSNQFDDEDDVDLELESIADIFQQSLEEQEDIQDEDILVMIAYINHMVLEAISWNGRVPKFLKKDLIEFYDLMHTKYTQYLDLIDRAWKSVGGPLVFRAAESFLHKTKIATGTREVPLPDGYSILVEAGAEGPAYDAICAIMSNTDEDIDDDDGFM